MRDYLTITKALADETRSRALLSLRDGELCLCQVIELLGLAPSTVSKHMTQLYQAGLVERRKEGRWHFYRLAGRGAPPHVKRALAWVMASLAGEPAIRADARALKTICRRQRSDSAACYRKPSGAR